ncbi:MAG: c-type cytochrome [Acidimicrobiales bacterium]
MAAIAGMLFTRPGTVRALPLAAAASRAPAAPRDAGTSTGREVFLRDCAVCHGADAQGTSFAPSLQGVGTASVDYWVSTGRMPLYASTRPAKSPENQPPPGQRLPDPDVQPHAGPAAYPAPVIKDLEAYIATIAPGGPPIPTVNLAGTDLGTGGELYRLQCAACHSWSGVGGALYQRAAPSVQGATPTEIAEAIETGPDQMPTFGPPAIPAGQLNDVVAYVRYLDHPKSPGGNPLWFIGPVAEGGIAILVGLAALLLICRWIGDRS